MTQSKTTTHQETENVLAILGILVEELSELMNLGMSFVPYKISASDHKRGVHALALVSAPAHGPHDAFPMPTPHVSPDIFFEVTRRTDGSHSIHPYVKGPSANEREYDLSFSIHVPAGLTADPLRWEYRSLRCVSTRPDTFSLYLPILMNPRYIGASGTPVYSPAAEARIMARVAAISKARRPLYLCREPEALTATV